MDKLIDKNECTGCGACESVCHADAIQLSKDDLGYLYPVVDNQKCVDCGRCVSVCHVKNMPILNKPQRVYAFQTKNYEILKKCGSGGFFSELGTNFIHAHGIVYGASMDIVNSKARLRHIRISNGQDIYKLQGSKYAISDSRKIFEEIETQLNDGSKVLFAGTPCQVAGLKSYLGREYGSLLTVDIFCHGNSPLEIFNKYLNYIAEKYRSSVVDYRFRNKEISKGYRARVDFADGKVRNLYTYQEGYWFLYQFSKINMKACYTCPYTTDRRCGDISCGDFWGIEVVRPDLYASFDHQYGISAILVNTAKGQDAFNEIVRNKENVILGESDMEDVKTHGAAVREPNAKPDDYDAVLKILENESFDNIVRYSKKQLGLRYYKMILADIRKQYQVTKR